MTELKDGFDLDKTQAEIEQKETELLQAEVEHLRLKQVDAVVCLEEALRHMPQESGYHKEMLQKAIQILQSEP